MKYRLMRTCREAAALMIAGEDRRLPLHERLALHLHLAMCKTCPAFRRQVELMRGAMGQWRRYAESDADAPPPGEGR